MGTRKKQKSLLTRKIIIKYKVGSIAFKTALIKDLFKYAMRIKYEYAITWYKAQGG